MQASNTDTVAFSKEQLEYLLKVFPPTVLPATATEAQLRHYNGQQTVIAEIQRRTRGVDPRYCFQAISR